MISTSYLPKINGVTRTVRDISVGLCQSGNAVTILTRKRGESGDRAAGCPHVVRVGIGRRYGESIALPLIMTVRATGIVRGQKINVLHAHGTIPGVVAATVKVLTGRKFVVTFHQDALAGWETGFNRIGGLKSHLTMAVQRFVVSRADGVTVQSEAVGQIIANVLKVSDKGKIMILPNPIDSNRLMEQGPRHAPSSRNVLYVGNLLRRKGVDVLLKAFVSIRQAFPECRLVIVGKGEEEGNLRRLARSLGVEDHAAFLGEVSDHQLLEAYRGTSVFVLPSQAEVFGIVLAEALLLETPVVATRTVGAESIIRDGRTGRLVNIGDSQGLAEAVVSILKDPLAAQELAASGRKYVETFLTLNAVIPRLEGIYRSLLGSE